VAGKPDLYITFDGIPRTTDKLPGNAALPGSKHEPDLENSMGASPEIKVVRKPELSHFQWRPQHNGQTAWQCRIGTIKTRAQSRKHDESRP